VTSEREDEPHRLLLGVGDGVEMHEQPPSITVSFLASIRATAEALEHVSGPSLIAAPPGDRQVPRFAARLRLGPDGRQLTAPVGLR
jgi:hypothetical protein